MERPDFFKFKNGEKVKLPFTNSEYQQRVDKLRSNRPDHFFCEIGKDSFHLQTQQKLILNQYQQY